MTAARVAGGIALGLFVALTAVNAMLIATDPDSVRPMRSGDPAPTFSLPVIGAGGEVGPEEIDLASLRGKIVVIDFWATWCEPCRASMPMLEKSHRELADRGVVFLSVNTEGPRKARAARAMVDQLSPSLLLLSDQSRVADTYKVDIIPHMVLIDRRGMVREVHRGLPRGGVSQLHEELERSLNELLSDR